MVVLIYCLVGTHLQTLLLKTKKTQKKPPIQRCLGCTVNRGKKEGAQKKEKVGHSKNTRFQSTPMRCDQLILQVAVQYGNATIHCSCSTLLHQPLHRGDS